MVLRIQKELDPAGVTHRKAHKLNRRVYHNAGPNFLIHLDGYDKLKPYGFAIHGCMDGFSRRVLWLKVSNTNNNTAIVASFFIDYIKEIQGVPRCVQMDAGTENVTIEDIQKAFRWYYNDDMCGIKARGKDNPIPTRLCDGLKTLGVLYEIRARGDKLKEPFCHCHTLLTVSIVDTLFIPELAQDGSNRRFDEEVVLTNWRDFLLDVEGGTEPITLDGILVFATGADRAPPLALNRGQSYGFTPPPESSLKTWQTFHLPTHAPIS